jgi:hypothetical protein
VQISNKISERKKEAMTLQDDANDPFLFFSSQVLAKTPYWLRLLGSEAINVTSAVASNF